MNQIPTQKYFHNVFKTDTSKKLYGKKVSTVKVITVKQ